MSLQASRIVRYLCILLPGSLFWALQLTPFSTLEQGFNLPKIIDPWRDEICGIVILVWTAVIVFFMRGQWQTSLAESYKGTMRNTLIVHVFVFGLAALMPDGGLALFTCYLTAVTFWMVVGMIILRRPLSPSQNDIAFISHGFLPFSFFVVVLVYLINFLPQ